MCLSVLQLFDDEVLNIYNTVKAKYEAMGPDKYKRFIHIEGVCQMASYLANEYHVNLKDAQIAALLHDYYKYETPEEMSKVLSKEEIEKEIDRIFDLVKPESKKDMGKIMKEANISLKGKADFKLVSEIVNSKLGA